MQEVIKAKKDATNIWETSRRQEDKNRYRHANKISIQDSCKTSNCVRCRDVGSEESTREEVGCGGNENVNDEYNTSLEEDRATSITLLVKRTERRV